MTPNAAVHLPRMRIPAIALYLCAIASTCSANIIDVSSQTTQLLQTGDSLEFLFSDASYAARATAMGLSPYPSALSFVFVSTPEAEHGVFTAELESPDGDFSTAFPAPIAWTAGYMQNSAYSGAVSALVGSLTLSSSVSQELFSDSEAELILTYAGPDVTVGRPGAGLRQDLTLSLSGGPLSMGATVDSADFDDGRLAAPSVLRTATTVAPTPEPEPIVLLGTGIAFCALAGVLKRAQRAAVSGAR